jgi:hypothetical protein
MHILLFLHLYVWRCLGGSSSKELSIVIFFAWVLFTTFQRGMGGGVVEVIVLLYLITVRDFGHQYS